MVLIINQMKDTQIKKVWFFLLMTILTTTISEQDHEEWRQPIQVQPEEGLVQGDSCQKPVSVSVGQTSKYVRHMKMQNNYDVMDKNLDTQRFCFDDATRHLELNVYNLFQENEILYEGQQIISGKRSGNSVYSIRTDSTGSYYGLGVNEDSTAIFTFSIDNKFKGKKIKVFMTNSVSNGSYCSICYGDMGGETVPRTSKQLWDERFLKIRKYKDITYNCFFQSNLKEGFPIIKQAASAEFDDIKIGYKWSWEQGKITRKMGRGQRCTYSRLEMAIIESYK